MIEQVSLQMLGPGETPAAIVILASIPLFPFGRFSQVSSSPSSRHSCCCGGHRRDSGRKMEVSIEGWGARISIMGV